LGVCAGIADWLDIPAALVRVVFIICVLSWPTLILAYFCLYFCLDKDITPEKMRNYFKNAKTADHFRQLDYHKPIYKNSRNKRIAGVCSGIADYFEIAPFIVRAITIGSLFIFGPYTVLAYIICMIVFDADPHAVPTDRKARKQEKKRKRHLRRQRRRERKNSYTNEEYTSSATQAGTETGTQAEAEFDQTDESVDPYSMDECNEVYNAMELRMREIEAFITSKKFRLHCEINRI
jgi:phage shock protein C